LEFLNGGIQCSGIADADLYCVRILGERDLVTHRKPENQDRGDAKNKTRKKVVVVMS
jgi:hypothetical protein